MPKVALFCTNFLPYSQSFVYSEIIAHRRYAVEAFCWRRMNEDRYPFSQLHVAPIHYGLTRRSRRFDRVLADGSFDLVHAHFGPGGCYAAPFAERHGLPLVVTFHGYDVPMLDSFQRFLPEHLPYALRAETMLDQMTLGLCVSHELREMLIERGVDEDKLHVHHLGIDLDRFNPAPRAAEPFEAVMVARFVPKKGLSYGIRAFAAASGTRAVPMRLTLIGDGPLQERLESLVAQLGVADSVEFVGVLDQNQVAERLAKAHVLMAPSVVDANGTREGCLTVVKEASASGCVPIGTYHGGTPEMIDHGKTGLLVPERNTQELSAALVRLVNEPELRHTMACNGRQKMRDEFELRHQVEELEERYDEAVDRYRSQRGRH